MPDSENDADRTLRRLIYDALGHQAAHVTHHIDRWFQQIEGRLSAIEARVEQRPEASADALPIGGAEEERKPASQDLAVEAAAEPPILPTLVRPPLANPRPPLITAPLIGYDLAQSWDGWTFHQSVRMQAGGAVELAQENSTPGVVSDAIALGQSGLLRVRVESRFSTGKDLSRPQARTVDGGGRPLGPDVELTDGTTEFFVFAAHHCTSLRVFIIATDPKTGFRFELKRVEIETVDAESYFVHNRPLALAPAIASMASVPTRRLMLQDCVASLLLQCDTVRVFLNDYPDVPAFLDHPRVEVRRSQDWDDKGDAGKFGWIEVPDAPGYRVIVDDDLVFPPDFVERLSNRVNASGNRAIYALHGVLLKQPVTSYYDPDSRSVFHFQNALRQDRTCHVLGTNALCYYSEAVKMTWADFMFRNMADIFFARYAQQHGLPMVAIARPPNWVRQNAQDGGFETIYESSLKKTKSKFDSSAVQDAMVKRCAPLTLQPTTRPKIVFLLLAFERDAFDAALSSWEKTRWLDYDWVVVLVSASDDAELRARVLAAKVPHELHVVDGEGADRVAAVLQAFELIDSMGFDLLCVSADHARFDKGVWTQIALGLCTGRHGEALFMLPGEEGGTTEATRVLTGQHLPALAVTSRETVTRVGHPDGGASTAADVVWRWLARLSSANDRPLLDPKVAAALADAIRVARPLDDDRRVGTSPDAATPVLPPDAPSRPVIPALTMNTFFRKVFIINLDRRLDRWTKAIARLHAAGVEAERFPAVDGSDPDMIDEFNAYKALPLRSADGVRKIESTKAFYQDYDSEAARVAFVEQKDKQKAIQSVGAWGYLRSWEKILERILNERIETALVLDDDVTFHKQSTALFAAAVSDLPHDWLLLQLGTLQYHWSPDWISWHNRFLYKTNGSAVGSHAVGLKFDAAPFLLEHVRRMLMPFDTGALAMATRAFKDRSFVIYPNVAIQALQEGSDISTSDFQKATDHGKVAETYRWDLLHYAE